MVNKNQSKKYCHLGHISCRLVVKILCLKLLPLWSYPYQICSENTLRPTFVRPPIVTQKGRHSWGEIDLKSLVSLILNHYDEIIDAVVCQVFYLFSLIFLYFTVSQLLVRLHCA